MPDKLTRLGAGISPILAAAALGNAGLICARTTIIPAVDGIAVGLWGIDLGCEDGNGVLTLTYGGLSCLR